MNSKWCRITPSGCNKWQGLCEVIKYDNGSIKDTISFGDDYGDYEMLYNSTIGVAMANSIDFIKDKIAIKTDSCNDDGVGKFLEKYFWRKR